MAERSCRFESCHPHWVHVEPHHPLVGAEIVLDITQGAASGDEVLRTRWNFRARRHVDEGRFEAAEAKDMDADHGRNPFDEMSFVQSGQLEEF